MQPVINKQSKSLPDSRILSRLAQPDPILEPSKNLPIQMILVSLRLLVLKHEDEVHEGFGDRKVAVLGGDGLEQEPY
jgi:hypothetical protein